MLGNRVNPDGLCHGCAGQAVAATQPAPQRQADPVQARSYTKSVLQAQRRSANSDSVGRARRVTTGTVPLRSWKVPVGPSLGRVARCTIASVPSVTVWGP